MIKLLRIEDSYIVLNNVKNITVRSKDVMITYIDKSVDFIELHIDTPEDVLKELERIANNDST